MREHNEKLVCEGTELVAGRLGADAAIGRGLTAAMRVVPLPVPLAEADAWALERRLLDEYEVVVPVTNHDGYRWVRVSAQLAA